MFVLLLLGVVAAVIENPVLLHDLAQISIGFRLPEFGLHHIKWDDVVTGTLLFTLPQIPLTLGNAVVAIAAENNDLFPDRPVTERTMCISQGIMNLISPMFGGVPMCHGAGGMAGHVRFGARTGGSLVILGTIVIVIALFFSQSVAIIFKMFPPAILGVILFLAGAELAVTVRDIGSKKSDFYILVVVAGFAMNTPTVGFLTTIICGAEEEKSEKSGRVVEVISRDESLLLVCFNSSGNILLTGYVGAMIPVINST